MSLDTQHKINLNLHIPQATLVSYEKRVSKTSYINSDMLLICIIDFLLQLK